MGFKIYCSFGEGLKVEDDQFYKDVIVESAKTFSTRFNSNVGSLRSWDFNDPAIPNAPCDASAAAVVTSALFELYGFTKNTTYLDFANRVLNNLNSSKYILSGDIEGLFILNHSTGNWPKNDEIDESISYADYYFLEALLRKKPYISVRLFL